MRRVFNVLLFLIAGLFLISFIVHAEISLRPLPVVAGGLRQLVTATATDQAGLQRAGYSFEDKHADMPIENRRQRSYAFNGAPGASALLVDNQYPPLVPTLRELVFDITLTVKEGQSPSDMRSIAPKLMAAMRRAVGEDPAIVAGLGYLATASGTAVAPEALQAAVIDYMQGYQQPTTMIREACAGCSSADGFGDEYMGGPNMHTRLNVAESGWTIAGTRSYFQGDSVFTLQVAAKIPRS